LAAAASSAKDAEKAAVSKLKSTVAAKRERMESQGSNQVTDGLGKADASYAELLDKAIKTGDFDCRGALGQRFTKAQKPGSSEHVHFKKQRTFAEKAKFRADWAKKELTKLQEKKVHTRTWEEVDKNLGTYLPVQVIA
jgi:hypothetical protein